MKKVLLALSLCFSAALFAQVTNEGVPKSWEKSGLTQPEAIVMPSFDLNALQAEDAINDVEKAGPWRFGNTFETAYDLTNSGAWATLDNGDRVWRARFQSEGAITMNLYLEDFFIPNGATLYLYNYDRTDLLGAYTAIENNEAQVLSTWLVDGDDLWIEYFEPAGVAGQGQFTIAKVVHGYRSQSQFALEKGLNDSGPCNHDVDCPIDPNLEDLKNHNKKGVVMLMSGASGFCSGSLINNADNDGTPYILSAYHCGTNPAGFSFRFGWISPGPICGAATSSSNGPTSMVMTGAQHRASRQQSDFHLMELNNAIPGSWDVVWNGWDNSDVPPTKTFGIHHPSGDIMKVCVDDDAPYHQTNPGQVWWIDSWDLGVTEGGSSGSPLFDDNGRIIGQLWGGAAACAGTNNNGQYDFYGRFGVSWATGGSASTQLKNWLDPDDTGITTLDPYPANNVSVADVTLENQLSIYPNPSTGVLHIDNATNESLQYTVFSMDGQVLTTGSIDGNLHRLDLSQAATGLYFVKITNGQTSLTKKVLLQ